jgi:hypothetical protein
LDTGNGGRVLGAPADLLVHHTLNGMLGAFERLSNMQGVSDNAVDDAKG